MDDMAMNIGEAKIAAGITVGEFLVIKSHEMKNGGVKIMHMGPVLDR